MGCVQAAMTRMAAAAAAAMQTATGTEAAAPLRVAEMAAPRQEAMAVHRRSTGGTTASAARAAPRRLLLMQAVAADSSWVVAAPPPEVSPFLFYFQQIMHAPFQTRREEAAVSRCASFTVQLTEDLPSVVCHSLLSRVWMLESRAWRCNWRATVRSMDGHQSGHQHGWGPAWLTPLSRGGAGCHPLQTGRGGAGERPPLPQRHLHLQLCIRFVYNS